MQGLRLETYLSRESEAEQSDSAERFIAPLFKFFSRGPGWKPLRSHEEGLDAEVLTEPSGNPQVSCILLFLLSLMFNKEKLYPRSGVSASCGHHELQVSLCSIASV